MTKNLNLHIDLSQKTIKVNNNKAVKVPKCKGLDILYFLNNHINQQFTPSKLRMNTENKQDVQYLQQDEYSYLINQACSYIPATDRQTINEVIQELRKNNIALEEAYELHDESKIEYLLDQNEMLQDYLNKSLNLNKTIKNLNQSKINNTKSIKRAISNLIQNIEEQDSWSAKIISDNLIVNSNQVCLLA